MGRPVYEVTDEKREQVRTMASMGMTQDDIGRVMGATAKTLRKHFREELELSAIEANTKVMQTLYTMATSGANTTASIFWAKTRCGLREARGEVTAKKKAPAERPAEVLPGWMPGFEVFLTPEKSE